MCQTNQIYQPGAFTYKNYPGIDFIDEPVVQYDVPIV